MRTGARSKRLLIFVDGTADAMFAVDAAGRISAWTNAAAELFGRSEKEVLTLPCHEILQCSTDNEMFRSEQCVLARVAQDNLPLANFDLRLQTKTGKQWCNLSTLIASDPSSGACQTLFVVRPREIRKRLEQALSEFVRTYGKNGSNGTSHAAINVRLTTREIEVLKSLAKGHSTRTIANQLNISAATVNNHIKHILTKFDVHTRLEAIRHAESVGVI
jgi:DNA-binding CsgD family transcriptional regulator